MNEGVTPDLYRGNWEGISFDERFDLLEESGGTFRAQMGSRSYPGLRLDRWQNLSGEDLCFSLHGQAGKIFGIEAVKGAVPYSVFAARRPLTQKPTRPIEPEDGPLFDAFLGKTLQVRVTQENDLHPVEPGDFIQIRKVRSAAGDTLFEIGKLSRADEGFEVFDLLYPDLANGTLNSLKREDGLERNVTCWENGKAPFKAFGMLTVPAQKLVEIHRLAAAHLPLRELANRFRLLLGELEALIRLKQRPNGDPFIVWGADDGG